MATLVLKGLSIWSLYTRAKQAVFLSLSCELQNSRTICVLCTFHSPYSNFNCCSTPISTHATNMHCSLIFSLSCVFGLYTFPSSCILLYTIVAVLKSLLSVWYYPHVPNRHCSLSCLFGSLPALVYSNFNCYTEYSKLLMAKGSGWNNKSWCLYFPCGSQIACSTTDLLKVDR